MKLSNLYKVLLVAEGVTRSLALAGPVERTIERRKWLLEQFGQLKNVATILAKTYPESFSCRP